MTCDLYPISENKRKSSKSIATIVVELNETNNFDLWLPEYMRRYIENPYICRNMQNICRNMQICIEICRDIKKYADRRYIKKYAAIFRNMRRYIEICDDIYIETSTHLVPPHLKLNLSKSINIWKIMSMKKRLKGANKVLK